MNYSPRWRVALVALGVLSPGLAFAQAAPPAQNLTDSCIDSFDPTVDYFPSKIAIEYAENFSVEYHDSYKIVTVNQPYPGAPPEHYVLVQCGAPVPELTGDVAGAQVVTVPVNSMFSASTTHNPMIEALDVVDRLTGVASLSATANAAILAAAAERSIVEFAPTYETNVELVVDAHPDMLLTAGSDDPAYATIRAAGIPVVADAEWLETNVLGRAEWIKYISLFFNREATATDVFGQIDSSYAAAAATVANLTDADKPLVFSGSAFEGVFYASGGQSYVAQTVAAAGGRYVFADNTDTGSIAFADLEEVLDRAGEASVWINAATTYHSTADIAAEEPRLAALPAAQSGQVWVYDRLQSPSGALGYWELGVLRPDLILKDMIKIFHPDLMTDYDFTFYRQVPAT